MSKYGYMSSDSKRRVMDRLPNQGLVQHLRLMVDLKKGQPPDLMLIHRDRSVSFAEVKNRDRVTHRQRRSHAELFEKFQTPVQLFRVRNTV